VIQRLFGAMAAKVDADRIQAAIRAAELGTSGEIRVSVAPFFWGDVERAAWRAFARLGMSGTAARNGVLFFFVPSRRRFVVLGDEGIHARVGQRFWDELRDDVAHRLAHGGEPTTTLVEAIEKVGSELAHQFPRDGSGEERNELSDEIDYSGGS